MNANLLSDDFYSEMTKKKYWGIHVRRTNKTKK